MKKNLTARDEKILLVLMQFDFMTRDQLIKHCKLGSIRNANRILYEISDYLQSIRDGYQSIYYLSKEGRAVVECDKIRKKGGHVAHTIMRNDFWFYCGCPKQWQNETKVTDGKTTIIVDAMYTVIQKHFLEVDNTKSMKDNRLKIDKYIELERNGLIKKSIGHNPAVIWLTTTELRRKQLIEACKGLEAAKVYTMDDIR